MEKDKRTGREIELGKPKSVPDKGAIELGKPVISGITYLGKNSSGYEEYQHNKTGIILIKIPAGEFTMGSDDIDSDSDERPVHKVYLDEYLIGKYPVTNEQFERFTQETGYKTEGEW